MKEIKLFDGELVGDRILFTIPNEYKKCADKIMTHVWLDLYEFVLPKGV